MIKEFLLFVFYVVPLLCVGFSPENGDNTEYVTYVRKPEDSVDSKLLLPVNGTCFPGTYYNLVSCVPCDTCSGESATDDGHKKNYGDKYYNDGSSLYCNIPCQSYPLNVVNAAFTGCERACDWPKAQTFPWSCNGDHLHDDSHWIYRKKCGGYFARMPTPVLVTTCLIFALIYVFGTWLVNDAYNPHSSNMLKFDPEMTFYYMWNTLLPFLDTLTDLLYITTSVFFVNGLFIASLFFFMLHPFISVCLESGPPRVYFIDYSFVKQYIHFAPDNIFKLFAWIIARILLIVTNIVCIAVNLPWIVPWFVFGMFLASNRLMCITRIKLFWHDIWCDRKPWGKLLTDTTSVMDLQLMNKEKAYGIVLESIPQMICNVTNTLYFMYYGVSNRITVITVVSFAFSGLMIIDGLYRICYVKCFSYGSLKRVKTNFDKFAMPLAKPVGEGDDEGTGRAINEREALLTEEEQRLAADESRGTDLANVVGNISPTTPTLSSNNSLVSNNISASVVSEPTPRPVYVPATVAVHQQPQPPQQHNVQNPGYNQPPAPIQAVQSAANSMSHSVHGVIHGPSAKKPYTGPTFGNPYPQQQQIPPPVVSLAPQPYIRPAGPHYGNPPQPQYAPAQPMYGNPQYNQVRPVGAGPMPVQQYVPPAAHTYTQQMPGGFSVVSGTVVSGPRPSQLSPSIPSPRPPSNMTVVSGKVVSPTTASLSSPNSIQSDESVVVLLPTVTAPTTQIIANQAYIAPTVLMESTSTTTGSSESQQVQYPTTPGSSREI